MRHPVLRTAAAAVFGVGIALPALCHAAPPASAASTRSASAPNESAAIPQTPVDTPRGDAAAIDVVFLVDCSSYMSVPLNTHAAQHAMASIVKQLRTQYGAKNVRAGMIRYGQASDGNTLIPLSSDSAEVDAMIQATQGDRHIREENAGAYIQMAVNKMAWSSNSAKSIYLLGNETLIPDDAEMESMNIGSVVAAGVGWVRKIVWPSVGPGASRLDYRDAIREAVQSGMTVNSIYCPAGSLDDRFVAGYATLLYGAPPQRDIFSPQRRMQSEMMAKANPQRDPTLDIPASFLPIMKQMVARRQWWVTAATVGGGESLLLNLDYVSSGKGEEMRRMSPNELTYRMFRQIPADNREGYTTEWLFVTQPL